MKTLLAFLLLCSQAFATSLCVSVIGDKQSISYGTAVVLDENKNKPNHWVAITARHVLEGSTPENTAVYIQDVWVPIQSVHFLDGNDDVAFLVFVHEKRFKVPTIATEDPGRGELVKWSGYSGGKKFERFQAKVQQVEKVAFAAGETRPRHGQSGGGVYDQDGRLCGVVSGYANDTGELIYTPMCHIQRRCQRQWGFGIGIGVGGGYRPPPPVIVAPAPPVLVVPSRPPREVEPEVAPPPPKDEKPNAEIQKQLDELRELIKAIPGCNCINKDQGKPSAHLCPKGERGPQGEKGERGDTGPQGAPGKSCQCDDGCKCDFSGIEKRVGQLENKPAEKPDCNCPPAEKLDYDKLAAEVEKRMPPYPAYFTINPLPKKRK